MTIEQLHAAIRAARYHNEAYIWYEDGRYLVSDAVLIDIPERVFVDTVAGYKQRHGIV